MNAREHTHKKAAPFQRRQYMKLPTWINSGWPFIICQGF